MAYVWNPLWIDVVDGGNPAYTNSARRMVVASINWLAEHPDAVLEWREVGKESLTRRAGVPAGQPVQIIAAWEDVYQPSNSHARHWFRAMSDACGTGNQGPSAFQMSKAILCGMLFKSSGWDEFDRFMLESSEPHRTPH